jgi:hypothetical protein
MSLPLLSKDQSFGSTGTRLPEATFLHRCQFYFWDLAPGDVPVNTCALKNRNRI